MVWAAWLACSPLVLACSCVQISTTQAQEQADVVFTGGVSAIDPDLAVPDVLQVTLGVSNGWKNTAPGLTLRVTTAANGATCGFPFQLGETYLVFAKRAQADQLPQQLYVSLCSGTKTLSEATAQDFEDLGTPMLAFTQNPTSETFFGRLTITPADQHCAHDDECAVVMDVCSECSCGAPVNRSHQARYTQALQKGCRDYTGGACDFFCPTPYAHCLSGRCALSATSAP
jgi:hypothetical protein